MCPGPYLYDILFPSPNKPHPPAFSLFTHVAFAFTASSWHAVSRALYLDGLFWSFRSYFKCIFAREDFPDYLIKGIHSYCQQIRTECLIWARHWMKHWRYISELNHLKIYPNICQWMNEFPKKQCLSRVQNSSFALVSKYFSRDIIEHFWNS